MKECCDDKFNHSGPCMNNKESEGLPDYMVENLCEACRQRPRKVGLLCEDCDESAVKTQEEPWEERFWRRFGEDFLANRDNLSTETIKAFIHQLLKEASVNNRKLGEHIGREEERARVLKIAKDLMGNPNNDHDADVVLDELTRRIKDV